MKLERQYRWLGLLTWFLMARLRLQSFWKAKDNWKSKFRISYREKTRDSSEPDRLHRRYQRHPKHLQMGLGLDVIVAVAQPHKLIFSFKNTCLALIFSEIGLLFGVF